MQTACQPSRSLLKSFKSMLFFGGAGGVQRGPQYATFLLCKSRYAHKQAAKEAIITGNTLVNTLTGHE